MTARRSLLRDSWLLPAVLSTAPGAVDVIGFLGLAGLFTAHISGNLCVVAVQYITGGFSRVGPLLSVPVFIAVLGAETLAFGQAGDRSRRALLVLHAALLAACLGLGARFGPFVEVDRPMALLVGMLAVAAMATQYVLVRLALRDSPPTAVMSTNITQLTIDLATLARGRVNLDDLAEARRRARVIFPCVVGIVSGCAAGPSLRSIAASGLWLCRSSSPHLPSHWES
jgi:uncharacterized membrane protein YoaK (UPF0700 family)